MAVNVTVRPASRAGAGTRQYNNQERGWENGGMFEGAGSGAMAMRGPSNQEIFSQLTIFSEQIRK